MTDERAQKVGDAIEEAWVEYANGKEPWEIFPDKILEKNLVRTVWTDVGWNHERKMRSGDTPSGKNCGGMIFYKICHCLARKYASEEKTC